MNADVIGTIIGAVALMALQWFKGSKYKKHVETVTNTLFEGAKIGRETAESVEMSAQLLKNPSKANLAAAQKEFADVRVVGKAAYDKLQEEVKSLRERIKKKD